MKSKHLKEVVALTMIGDGLLTAINPSRHLRLWRVGPKTGIRALDTLLRHPRFTRVLGAASVAGGIWWASRQKPNRKFSLQRTLRIA